METGSTYSSYFLPREISSIYENASFHQSMYSSMNVNSLSFMNIWNDYSDYSNGTGIQYGNKENINNDLNNDPNIHYRKPPSFSSLKNLSISRKAKRKALQEKYVHLREINPPKFDCEINEAKMFVVKCSQEEYIHQALRSEVWWSHPSYEPSKILNNAFENSKKNKSYPIYLFFSSHGTGVFCGVALLKSGLIIHPPSGYFKIKWIFLKDIPNSVLRDIEIKCNGNKPFTHSKDGQEIEKDKGILVLSIFAYYRSLSSILDDFAEIDNAFEDPVNSLGSWNPDIP